MSVKVPEDKINKTTMLDSFRIIAAILVVAIHTSPLSSISEDADFFVTRVLARIAVPFFFMITGHYVLGKNMYCLENKGDKILRQLKKLLILYGIAIVMYLPVGLYAGHYEEISWWNICKMLFFDGTFYHLWYFPAVIMGIGVVWLMGRVLSLKELTFITGVLYVLGLLGDSYYGMIQSVPFLNNLYRVGFHISTYTRNGIFFAPLFLVLGIWMSRVGYSVNKDNKKPLFASGLVVSFVLMTAEAFLLRYFNIQRHDSMYLFLLPTMIFLYQMLLEIRGKTMPMIRTATTWIYILHPAMIIAIRLLARITGVKALIENSVLHYCGVVVLSVVVAGAISFIMNVVKKKWNEKDKSIIAQTMISEKNKKADTVPDGRAWIEIDREALSHNVKVLQSRLPKDCILMPAVKANAYGHGAIPVAKELQRLGIQSFCVACVAEGVELRNAGIKGEILILGYTNPADFEMVYKYGLTQTVIDYEYALLLQQFGREMHVHVAVDTGMNRLGERHENIDKIIAIFKMSNLIIEGMFTHLSSCDSIKEREKKYTEEQLDKFKAVVEALENAGIEIPKVHMHASYGVLNNNCVEGDYVRVGIALYGMLSTKEDTRLWGRDLKPVLSLKARIVNIKDVHKGETVGYGLDELAKEDGKIAALPIGYADGFPRELSYGKGYVIVRGQKAPIIGRICMDQTLIDVRGIEGLKEGDEVIIIGEDDEIEITACDLAKQAGTISNEILSRLGSRLNRII